MNPRKLTKRKYYAVLFWELFWISVYLFGVWQHDLITAPPVWSEGWCHPVGRYADDFFQCWVVKTTVGEFYDLTFGLMFLSLWMCLFGMALLSIKQYLELVGKMSAKKPV